MTRILSGKTALITGGTVALALIKDGASVMLVARRADALEEARRELLGQVPR